MECRQLQIIFGFCFIIIFAALGGCSASRKAHPVSKETGQELRSDFGDAFLYDVKIYRNGKKNSVRLDLYHLNEFISLYTRGYLGKGVLKGAIYGDSSIIYLPTENEFYTGKLGKFVNENCFDNAVMEKVLIEMFHKTPLEIAELQSDFDIALKENRNTKKSFFITSKKCDEIFEIEYKLLKDRWFPEEIKYENQDKSFKITAKNRKQKFSVKIPAKKILLDIPTAAQRIVP
jgi:hypothetical protein